MICQRCHEREATLHLTTVAEDEVQKLHLCQACADQAGFSVEGPVSVSDLLLGLAGGTLAAGDPAPAAKPALTRSVPACAECGLTLAQFKKRSRLGCPACYAAFQAALTPVMRAVHRHDRHRGKVPAGRRTPADNEGRLSELRQRLAAAVKAEEYEEAAALRDRLRNLEPDPPLAEGGAPTP